MKTKRWIGALFCMLLCIGMLPAMAFAAEPAATAWDGSSVATAYESGEGTKASPYEIATAEQFAYFAEQIKAGAGADAYYILSSDLDMSAGNWYPIGCTWSECQAGHYFYGNLNGNGHCVTYKLDVQTDINSKYRL